MQRPRRAISLRTLLARGAWGGVALALVATATGWPFVHAASAAPAAATRASDAAPATFAEYCEAELPAERRARFDRALSKAEEALAKGNRVNAERPLEQAFEAAARGGANSDVSIKCLGETVARRWFEAQLQLKRLRAAADAKRNRVETPSLYAMAADQGAQAIVKTVEGLQPPRVVASIGRLEGIAERLDGDRQWGAFILPEEVAIERACREAVRDLRNHAAREHQSAMEAEAASFTRTITDQDLAASGVMQDARGLANTFFGVDVGSAADKDVIMLRIRTSESLENLRLARLWDLEREANPPRSASSGRARQRGDELLARAGENAWEKGASLALRDALYREARRYYDFGGFEEAAKAAATAHKSIESELREARLRQEEAVDQDKTRFNVDAQSIQKAAEDVMKTDAEKERFKHEADALEDELGL